MEQITKRNIISYTDSQLWDITNRINMIKLDIDYIENKTPIYDNQLIASHQIITNFQNRHIVNQMILGKTQSGKTGTMLSTIKIYVKNFIIPIENIYIITGLSSIEWKTQTKERLPMLLEKRVFHRGDLNRFHLDVINKQNVLIIMDEMHIASKVNMSIHKNFKKIGLLDLNYLLTNDIKILEFTATPEGTLYDLCKWGIHSITLNVEPGLNYIGAIDLLRNNQVREYKKLCYKKLDTKDHHLNATDRTEVKNNIKELVKCIDKYTDPKYHIIRTMNGNTHTHTMDLLIKENKEYTYIIYDESTPININDIIEIKPLKNTIIFIKEKLRCAKTLIKDHLGVLYERFTNNPDDTVIIQGLLGRLTGYHNNSECIIFTNIETIYKYEELWNSNFNKNYEWLSKTTKSLNGVTISSKTFNGDIIINGEPIEKIKKVIKPFIFKSKIQNDCIEFVKNYFITARGPRILIANNKGYFETKIRNIKKVRSCDEILVNASYALHNNTNYYRYYACYSDPTNKSTLEFWVIYKPIVKPSIKI